MNGKIHGLIDGRINARIDQQGALLNQIQFDGLAPTLLNVTRNISTEIDLAWTVNSTNLDGSRIYKSTDGVTYTALATVSGNTATYTASGLTAGGLYYFKVVSYKGATETDATNIYDTRLKLTVDTTKAGSAADTFVLPTTGTGYDAYVDWGDGSALQNITGTPGNVSHTYSAQGAYQVKVHGTFKQLYFNNGGDKLKLTTIDNWGTSAVVNCNYMFSGCSNVTGNYIDTPNTSDCTDFSGMFRFCTVFNGVLNLNTSKATNMYLMFSDARAFNKSLSSFDTSNVTNMAYMFSNAKAFNKSVSTFNTSKVTTMEGMFNDCTAFKQSLASFNMATVANVSWMLNSCNINETGTTTNYDNTLIAWAAQDLVNSLSFSGGTSKYSAGAGATARAAIIADDLWTITDGGQA